MDGCIAGWMQGWMDEYKLVSVLNLCLHQEVGSHTLSPGYWEGDGPKPFFHSLPSV